MVNPNLDIVAEGGFTARSVHGPSQGDYQFARDTGVPGIIVDRTNVYNYGYRNGSNFAHIIRNTNIIRNMYTLPFWFR